MASSNQSVREGNSGEAFYESLYDNAPEMIAIVGVDAGDIRECNPSFAHRLDSERQTVRGHRLDAYVTPTDDDAPAISTALKAEHPNELLGVEVTVEPRQDESFFASLNATPVEGTDPPVARITLHDITELKQAQRDLTDQTERLKQSNRELEQFAYLASHDLQEPLRMVASYTQLLARRYEGEIDEQADKYIRYAVDGAERMKALLNDLLEYSRIGRNDEASQLHAADELLDKVVANLSVKIAETGGSVEYENLPEIYGVRSQLLSLFQNLVDNGLKFSEDGTPTVQIRGERHDDSVVFAVEDNGIGFETDNASKIFQVFQRLHERDRFEGTGAGLSIVKKVIDYHDGDIEVDSQPGEGTTFRLTLPLPT